ncbi:7573_t:CDS:2 [Paraglomus brasilianum]|uniref:7573_t:CDS:1 n=1 Tax=Paraglomus brasilianum TaxID=144538 RepID=A0A9N9AR33_9GLOM|nr:7573_t:CDS:2 [Paraglomus brasilianum]
MINKSHSSALLYFSLTSLASITYQHLCLIKTAIQQTTDSLTLVIDILDIDEYRNTWTPIHDLLSTLYVEAAKYCNEIDKTLFDLNIVFGGWCGYDVGIDDTYEVLFGHMEDQNYLLNINMRRKQSFLPEIPIHLIACSPVHTQVINIDQRSVATKTYNVVAVGGTFDHLHSGHKILLTMSVWITKKKLICGVTGENMLTNKKYREVMESLDTRIENVQKFLNKIKRGLTYEVVPIYDIYGPTATDPEIEALVVSKETLEGANLINKERALNALPPLEFAVIEVISSTSTTLKDEDLKNLKLSSTFLREYIFNKNEGK